MNEIVGYSTLMGLKVATWFKVPTITGTVIDLEGKPISNAIIRLSSPATNELEAVVTSDKTGAFRLFSGHHTYQLSIVKEGYLWTDAGETLSFYEITTKPESQHLIATMKPMTDIYEDLFGTTV